MPTLLETKQIQIEFADLDRLVPKRRIYTGPRSSGIHLSGVIRYVLISGGLLTEEDQSDLMPLRMAVGMAWEAFIVQLWPRLIWQPKECRLDGVIGTPDGITPGEPAVLEEVKATWRSRLERSQKKGVRPPDRNIVQQKYWMLQIAGYLKIMGLTMARLHVLWVDGDYRGSGPEYFTYLIQFTQAELDRTWNNMILPNIGGAKAEQHG